MRIAVVSSTYPPYRGGMGNVAADHARALSATGHQVTVFAPGHNLRPLFRFGNAACVPQLLWKLRGFDAVELHYPFFGGAEWVGLWKRIFGRRARLAVFYHMDTVGRGALALIFRLYRALGMKSILAAADAIMVSSRSYLESSHASYLKDDARVHEVPFAVDTDRFHPGGEKKKAALFVGGLDRAHYFKGVPVLLEAFAALPFSDAELWIVGDGDLRASYEAQASVLGLGDRIRFFGGVDDERLVELYRAATVHVLPSVDRSEAFGLVTLSAAASGTASIVSDLPGVRDVIEPGVTGLRVPPGDANALSNALGMLLGDSELAARMGTTARERALRLYARTRIDEVVARVVSGRS